MSSIVYATLDPNNKRSTIVLSNGNLTATSNDSPANWSMFKATQVKTTGKWYFEIYINALGAGGIGLSDSLCDVSVGNQYMGQDPNGSHAYNYANGGDYYTNNGVVASHSSYAAGDTVGVAFDADAETVEFFKNNTSQGSVSCSGLNSDKIPTFMIQTSAATFTANFGATPLTYTPPTGFNAGVYSDLLDDIESYWKLDETSGNAADSAGSNTLTNNNTVTYVPAVIANGADLERGSSQYLSITNGAQTGLDFDASDAFSFSFWLNFESFPASSGFFFLITKGDGSTGYLLNIGNAGGTISLEMNINAGFYSQSYAFSLATWYYVTVTWSGISSTLRYYINGSSIGTDSTVSTVSASSNGFAIGTYEPSPSNYFDGIIDECGIWSRALSLNEVEALYNSGTGLTYPFSSSSGPANLKSLDTNLKANIKSYNTNLLANIKSINTNP